MQEIPTGNTRWQLYRLLSDPMRLRLLALAAEEELSVGELSEVLREPQPNVSRHAAPLRRAGLLANRKQGTRTLLQLAEHAGRDPVVADALAAGRRLCLDDGSLARVGEIVAARDQRTREHFEQLNGEAGHEAFPEQFSYLSALGQLIEKRDLVVDAGTGGGVLLGLLSPIFERVIAVDRSDAQLERARARIRTYGLPNVELINDRIGGDIVQSAVGEGADLVLAARVLHHAPLPREGMADLVRMARPGGRVLIIDYARHEDERFRDSQADVWMGFAESELTNLAERAGLSDVRVSRIPAAFVRSPNDSHLNWLTLIGTRTAAGANSHRKSKRNEGKRPS